MGNPEKYGKMLGIIFCVLIILCVFSGCICSSSVYEYLNQWCIYTVVANGWSTLKLLGVTVLDVILFMKPVVGTVVRGIQSIESRPAKGFLSVTLAALYLIAAWVCFVGGVSTSKLVEKSTEYRDGNNVTGPDKLGGDIYVRIVMGDGQIPQDTDLPYEIIDVEPLDLPLKIVLPDFPRYFACQTFGAGPIKVTVRPLYPDITVRFVDPLVSVGEKVVVQKYDPDLLGSAMVGNRDDYSPVFKYCFTGTSRPCYYTIRGVENTLEMQKKTVCLWWDNEWKLSGRDILKHQHTCATAGDTVYFYYPGERIVFDLNMIQNSESPDKAFLEKLRRTEQYELTLESVDTEAVQCDETVTDRAIFPSGQPEQTKCMIKIGPDIVYHCWAGAEDLGCYCIVTRDGVVKWETAPEEEPAVVLHLNIG